MRVVFVNVLDSCSSKNAFESGGKRDTPWAAPYYLSIEVLGELSLAQAF